MTAGSVIGEASASWQALGTGVQLIVTDAHQIAAARQILEADLAAVDLACGGVEYRLSDLADAVVDVGDPVDGEVRPVPLADRSVAVLNITTRICG